MVNDTVILESEVHQRARVLAGALEKIQDTRERQRQYQALLRQVADDLVNEELILQAAACIARSISRSISGVIAPALEALGVDAGAVPASGCDICGSSACMLDPALPSFSERERPRPPTVRRFCSGRSPSDECTALPIASHRPSDQRQPL